MRWKNPPPLIQHKKERRLWIEYFKPRSMFKPKNLPGGPAAINQNRKTRKMIIFRKHAESSLEYYTQKLRQGYLPTQGEADRVLGKGSVPVEIQVPEHMLLACISSESLEVYGDERTKGKPIDITLRRGPKAKCTICLRNTRRRIPCGCPFHLKCIREASAYSPLCPVCQSPLCTNPKTGGVPPNKSPETPTGARPSGNRDGR